MVVIDTLLAEVKVGYYYINGQEKIAMVANAAHCKSGFNQFVNTCVARLGIPCHSFTGWHIIDHNASPRMRIKPLCHVKLFTSVMKLWSSYANRSLDEITWWNHSRAHEIIIDNLCSWGQPWPWPFWLLYIQWNFESSKAANVLSVVWGYFG